EGHNRPEGKIETVRGNGKRSADCDDRDERTAGDHVGDIRSGGEITAEQHSWNEYQSQREERPHCGPRNSPRGSDDRNIGGGRCHVVSCAVLKGRSYGYAPRASPAVAA